MKTWLTRNWLPLLVIGIVLAVTAVTISIPQWKANPVSGHAAVAVSPGESYEMGGVTMRLKPVQLPPLESAFEETTAGRDRGIPVVPRARRCACRSAGRHDRLPGDVQRRPQTVAAGR